jgi:hypothetical protein
MYINAKITTVETIQGMGKGGIKENDGGVIHCNNFINDTM